MWFDILFLIGLLIFIVQATSSAYKEWKTHKGFMDELDFQYKILKLKNDNIHKLHMQYTFIASLIATGFSDHDARVKCHVRLQELNREIHAAEKEYSKLKTKFEDDRSQKLDRH